MIPNQKDRNFKPHNTGRRILHQGRFLRLDQIQYVDHTGTAGNWEAVARVAGQGAVLIICWLQPSDRLLLVRQYRPPAAGDVWEFPAGVIDQGETPEAAVLRELKEETGFFGQLQLLTPGGYDTPGLSSDKVFVALVKIDENLPQNQAVSPSFQEGELIHPLLVSRTQLGGFITEQTRLGVQFDSKVLAYLLAATAQGQTR